MHRLAALPGAAADDEAGAYVEQPPAPVLLLSSADTDLLAVDTLLRRQPELLGAPLRGLNLAALAHPAVLDHYLATTAADARIVVVRLLGGRGHWSYGLEQLQLWVAERTGRHLLVLAGTAEEENSLASLSSANPELAISLARCLREGGEANLRAVLACLGALLRGEAPELPTPVPGPDPLPHDWRPDPGPRIGLILYRSWLQAGDLALMEAALSALRQRGLCPRALWVSGLREAAVQRGVGDLLQREGVAAVLCATGFASVQFEQAGLGAPLWERLGVPVLQLLCSSRPQQAWASSSIGLAPTDLTLQVALPELDGRLTTRIGAFKETVGASAPLASALHRYRPDPERLGWIAELTRRWVDLRRTPVGRRRVGLVLANYPNRNSRVANGVGLDTPASAALMLHWLQEAGYGLEGPVPVTGQCLIERLLAGLSNDPESAHRNALDHLPLAFYQAWYSTLPEQGRERLERLWGPPDADTGLVAGASGSAFPIRGLRFGLVCLLIQPERGYDRDPSLSYHSPDLPPTHAYLAQYLWLRESFAAQVVVHVGKHGNLEWLPGKGLGLSDSCFPEWALGPLPHLYPFILNDPGEGAQAKRRSQAVILDHLTPPLGRAGLHGGLQELEALLDEYWEAVQVGSERTSVLRPQLASLLERLQLPLTATAELDERLDAADGYLCELKEAQIRLGLHIYGTLPKAEPLAELLLCLARSPQEGLPGLTQALARDLELLHDPWADPDDGRLDPCDRQRLQAAGAAEAARWRHGGDATAWLEEQALQLCRELLAGGPAEPWGGTSRRMLGHVREVLLQRLRSCGAAEKQAFLAGLAGERIAAGPAGAPTRGRPDLLPTGRNFYAVDLRGLPTEAAWDLGRRSAELLLELHLQDEGEHLRTLALSVWGTSTMRNGGEDIAQALALLGVRPLWDGPSRRLVDLEVIPLTQLGRPRVDVTLRISGLFRDAFPQLVGLFNHATALVAGLDESETANPLAAAVRREGRWSRVYGSAPGAYGAGLQGLIDSGNWEGRADLAQAYLNWSAWAYGGGGPCGPDGSAAGSIEAEADREGLEQRLAAVQVVLHNQDNREHDLLDSDDYYQFQGGLSAAVELLSGRAPALWFGDHSRSARPRVHRLEKEFDKVLRSRLLNPRWIDAMRRHGYKGGFEMAASLDYLFAYDASTGRVPDWSYGAISDRWLGDATVLGFLEQCNPWALRDMAERLLEAHHRGLWDGASEHQLTHLRQLVLESEARIEQR
jgi:cobaltochelatase CobN